MPTYNVKVCREMEWRVTLWAESEWDAEKTALLESRNYGGATILDESVKTEAESE